MKAGLDLTDKAHLREAVEEAFCAYWLGFGEGASRTRHADDELTWFTTGLASATYNAVLRARVDGPPLEARIGETVALLRALETPFAWWTGPGSAPPTLGERLQELGFVHDEDQVGMAVPLDQVPSGEPVPEGWTLRAVDGRRDLQAWAAVVAESRGDADGAADLVREAHAPLGASRGYRRFLATFEGEPVGASLLHEASGVAGLHALGVVPEHRGHGFGSALARGTLRESGAALAVVFTTALGLRTFRRLGFREACIFRRYEAPPPDA